MGKPKPVKPTISKSTENTEKIKKKKGKVLAADNSPHEVASLPKTLNGKKVLKDTKTNKQADVLKDTETVKQPKSEVGDLKVVKMENQQIIDGVQAFTKLLELNSAESKNKNLFSSEGQKVGLQISAIKIPRENECQVIKMTLPHCPLNENKDVCLFVKDLEKGLKVDHEGTVQHFKNLLADRGVTDVTEVISLRELKVEYKEYEAKIKLSNRFDKFLADDRIIRFLPQFLGKHFYKKKKLPIQVNLSVKDLKSEFEKCLNTTILPLKNTGSCSQVIVGHSQLSNSQLVDNIKTVVTKLEEKYPGGWNNIRSIHLNSGTTSLPLYMSIRSTADVGIVSGLKRPYKEVVIDELSTVVGGTVVVTPSGNVRVKRAADPDWLEEDETLKDLVAEKEGTKSDDENDEDEKTTPKETNSTPKKESTNNVEKNKNKKAKKEVKEDESEDEMEDQELEYMKKVAEEEEKMEKQLEENENQLSSKLNAVNQSEKADSSDDEEEVDDDAEPENLLSEGDSSDSDDDLVMKKPNDVSEDEEETPVVKKKKKSVKKAKKESSNANVKDGNNKKSKKQQKFIEKKKKEKLKPKASKKK